MMRPQKMIKADLLIDDDRIIALLVSEGYLIRSDPWLISGLRLQNEHDTELYITEKGVAAGLGPRKGR